MIGSGFLEEQQDCYGPHVCMAPACVPSFLKCPACTILAKTGKHSSIPSQCSALECAPIFADVKFVVNDFCSVIRYFRLQTRLWDAGVDYGTALVPSQPGWSCNCCSPRQQRVELRIAKHVNLNAPRTGWQILTKPTNSGQ